MAETEQRETYLLDAIHGDYMVCVMNRCRIVDDRADRG